MIKKIIIGIITLCVLGVAMYSAPHFMNRYKMRFAGAAYGEAKKAEMYLDDGNYDKAIQHFKKALEIVRQTKNTDENKGFFDEDFDDYRNEDVYGPTLYWLMMSYRLAGRPGDAVNLYKAENYHRYGIDDQATEALLEMGNTDAIRLVGVKNEEMMNTSTGSQTLGIPRSSVSRSYMYVSEADIIEGKYKDAVGNAVKSVELDDSKNNQYWRSMVQLGKAYLHNQQYSEAINTLKSVLGAKKTYRQDFPLAAYYLAKCYQELGRTEDALAEYIELKSSKKISRIYWEDISDQIISLKGLLTTNSSI